MKAAERNDAGGNSTTQFKVERPEPVPNDRSVPPLHIAWQVAMSLCSTSCPRTGCCKKVSETAKDVVTQAFLYFKKKKKNQLKTHPRTFAPKVGEDSKLEAAPCTTGCLSAPQILHCSPLCCSQVAPFFKLAMLRNMCNYQLLEEIWPIISGRMTAAQGMLLGSALPGTAGAEALPQRPADGAGSCREAHVTEDKPLGLETPALWG